MSKDNESFEKAVAPWVSILINGKRTLIDREDEGLLEGWHLNIKSRNTRPYVNCRKTINGKRVNKMLHRLILGDDSCYHVDHINGDSLDNRKSNLRYVNHSMNMRNQQTKDSSKLPRYIFKNKYQNEYRVYFRKRENGKRITLGDRSFTNLLDAVMYRDKWIIDNDWFGLREYEFNRAHEWTKRNNDTSSTHHDMYRDYENRLQELQAKYDKAIDTMKFYNKQLPPIGSRITPELIELVNDAGKKLKQTLKELGELNE